MNDVTVVEELEPFEDIECDLPYKILIKFLIFGDFFLDEPG